MRKFLAFLFAAVLAFGFAGNAIAAEDDAPSFALTLTGGYTVLPMSIHGVTWYRFKDKRETIETNDDSYLDPGYPLGLSFSYFPKGGPLPLYIAVEGDYRNQQGKLKGSVGPFAQQEYYEYDTSWEFIELHFLAGLSFWRGPFRPFLQLGFGAARTSLEIESDKQVLYAGSVLADLGAEYRFAPWFAWGAQARFQDVFGLRWEYDAGKTYLAVGNSEVIPLSLLMRVSFLF